MKKNLIALLLVAACGAAFCLLQPNVMQLCKEYNRNTYNPVPYYVGLGVSVLLFSLLVFAVLYVALTHRNRRHAKVHLLLALLFAAVAFISWYGVLTPLFTLNYAAMTLAILYALCALAQRKSTIQE